MKIKSLLLVLLIFAFILSACSPAQAAIQRLVELPGTLVLLIESAVAFLVGWIFATVGQKLPWFVKLFGKYADDIAYAISGSVLLALQTWLNMIPPAWETVGNLALALIVAVLAALQVFRMLGRASVKTFRP